jgi:hypothetical protein
MNLKARNGRSELTPHSVYHVSQGTPLQGTRCLRRDGVAPEQH